MTNMHLKEKLWKLIEEHTPTYLVDEQYIAGIVDAICSKENFDKRELLMLAYWVGASLDETNELLVMHGYSELYVKKWEDAVWYFVINRNTDLNTVFNYIFPQQEDYK